MLAGWQLFILLKTADERDGAYVNFRQSLRPLVFLSGRPAFTNAYGGIELL